MGDFCAMIGSAMIPQFSPFRLADKENSTSKNELLAQLRKCHQAQTSLRLFGEAGENHGDVIAGVFVAGAGYDDAVALDFAVVAPRLQFEGHLRPGGEGHGAAKFNAALVEDHRVR